MNNIVKTSCLAIYLLAVIGGYGVLPAGMASAIQLVAVVLVAAHALELLVAFKAVQRHPGPLVDSIALTLLFGFLHWLPLRKRRQDL
jgi:uncharacterized protein YhhL (DUF1145 family)